MVRLVSTTGSSYNPAVDDAQNAALAVLQQNIGSIRVGNGVPTDASFLAAGGTIPASTAQSPMWIDRETGNTYWRDGATNTWLALGTGASVPTFDYPLLLGSSSYADFETKAAGSTLVPVARIFEQTTGTYGMPTFAGSNLEVAMNTPGRSYVWSCKPTMSDLVAQTAGLETRIDNFLSALVADIGAVGTNRWYLCVHHEPCPDYTPSDFKAGFEWWADKVIALGRPDIIPTFILRGNGDFETSGLNNAHRPTTQKPDGWTGTETTIYSWFPDDSYQNDVVIGFDPYSYWPGRTSNTTTSNDRSLRHLMRIILPAVRARGWLRWGIAENGIQEVQPDPQFGGGDPPSTSTDWTDQDRLDRWTGAQAQYRNQSLGSGPAHPGYLAWLTAQAGPFPDPSTASVAAPYDPSQTAATQYSNPGQAYDAGSNGCEYYCYFNEQDPAGDPGSWQGEYRISAAMADALLTAAAGL